MSEINTAIEKKSENSMQLAMKSIGNMVGLERMEIVDTFKQWNKNKYYPVNIVNIDFQKDGSIITNSKQYGEAIEMLNAYGTEMAKNTLDAEVITDIMATRRVILATMVGMRKQATNPIKGIVAEYTAFESECPEVDDMLKKKFEQINEVEWEKRADSLRAYFHEIIAEEKLTEVISIEVFKDFIDNKRKTSFYTSKQALNSKIKGEMENALRLVVEPLKQEKELKEKKSLQSKQFEAYMSNFNADGDANLLKANIIQLEKFKESVPNLYPAVEEECIRSIDNKIALMSGNIRAINSKAEADAIKNADGVYLEMYNNIKETSQDMTLDIEVLKELASQLRVIYPKMKFAENQLKVKNLGASLNQRVTELEIAQHTPVVEEPVVEEPVATHTAPVVEDSGEQETYVVSIHDIEVLAGMEIEASNEDDAKEQLVARFRAHLSMIDLIKKGE